MPALVLILGSSLMMASEIYHEVRFVEMPQYSVALPGDSVYFSCATNLPTSLEEITWLHNGQVLKHQQDKFHIDKGQLTFKISTDPLVYKSQEGSYQCIGGASGSKFKIASIGNPFKFDLYTRWRFDNCTLAEFYIGKKYGKIRESLLTFLKSCIILRSIECCDRTPFILTIFLSKCQNYKLGYFDPIETRPSDGNFRKYFS